MRIYSKVGIDMYNFMRWCLGFYLTMQLFLFAALLGAEAESIPHLIPMPSSVEVTDGGYTFDGSTGVYADPQLSGSVAAVNLLLGPAMGVEFTPVENHNAGILFLYESGLGAEAYRLVTGTGGIVISAATEAGAFYALQTLRQLLPTAIYSNGPKQVPWRVAGVKIEDEPRFRWRGMHLDVGRHFMPLEFVKKYVDLLAAHKMNTFHWHLTEDQGWRIEIKQYPKLTEIGSWRAQTVSGHVLFQENDELSYDGIPHGGFYTQQEVRELVSYAAQRHVNVVPEIEFPGHAESAIASYPELGNTGEKIPVKEEWGISENTLKPSDETLQFYLNVLKEVLALFPSPYIHIGGDEVPKTQWQESAYAQQRIRELGLADENELQSWLIAQMDEYLTNNGRRMVGWDEIMQGGLSPNATVMSWRGMAPGRRAAAAGHDVVMAPTRWTYFDYYQASPKVEPLAIGMYLSLKDVYAFDPIPAGLPPAFHEHILGAQGQLWTEYMKTPEHVEYMAYPRAIALAEVLWSPRQAQDYASFLERLPPHLARLDMLKVQYRELGNDELGVFGHLEKWIRFQWTDLFRWWSDIQGK